MKPLSERLLEAGRDWLGEAWDDIDAAIKTLRINGIPEGMLLPIVQIIVNQRKADVK